jgi:hypothetical protein
VEQLVWYLRANEGTAKAGETLANNMSTAKRTATA